MEILETHEVAKRLVVLAETDDFGGSWVIGVVNKGDTDISFYDLAGKRQYTKSCWSIEQVKELMEENFISVIKANPYYMFG